MSDDHSPPRIMIAVCTYNEAENIHAVLSGLRRYAESATLVVVDDNSPDGTANIVREFAAADRSPQRSTRSPQSPERSTQLIVRRERGLGGAIRRAIELAIEGDFDWLVNLDGDLSHDPAQVPRLLAAALAESNAPDVVVGSRYMPGGEIIGWPLRRRWMSQTVNHFANAWLRLPVSDCSGSMRCYRVSKLKQIDNSLLRSNGYALLEELLVALMRSGATLVEVPITFTDRTRGHSKLTFREAVRSASEIVRLALRR